MIIPQMRGGFRRLSSKMVPKVQVKQGLVIGGQQRLPNGNLFNFFKGIPYAEPPLGHLRFKSPVPLERFLEPELDCTTERDISHQRDPLKQEVLGSENCLFLNVYSPQHTKSNLPVMVWIHGGGYWFGNGNSDYHYPKHLLEENVVVVTMNYRLGALGFLCLPEENIFGNAGLKDQRLALQWIHENISNFGGDPKNVTIFGESAGAASVHLHLYAKHAKILFQKAIMQSGTANMEWAFQASPGYKTHKLAQLLGCKSKSSKDVFKFLQSDQVTPLMILENTLPVLTPDERRRCLPLPFKPVIEDVSSPDSFVYRPILDSLRIASDLDIPVIMGYNSAEGMAMLLNAMRKLEAYDRDLARCIPRNLDLSLNDTDIKIIAKKMRDFYFKGQSLSQEHFNDLVNLLSDFHFTIDIQLAAKYHSRYLHKSKLYFYRFDYVGNLNFYKKLFQMEKLKGASHGDELFYLFQMWENEELPQEKDLIMSKRLCKLWANFAKSGNPTPNKKELPIIDCIWEPVKKLTQNDDPFVLDYLSIDIDSCMKKNPDNERIDFWRNIYNTYNAFDYSKLSAKL